jgi:hypothetical protein
VQLTAPHEIEPDRRQIHPANRTFAGLIVNHFWMHGTGPGERRQRLRRDRRKGAQRGEKLPAANEMWRDQPA